MIFMAMIDDVPDGVLVVSLLCYVGIVAVVPLLVCLVFRKTRRVAGWLLVADIVWILSVYLMFAGPDSSSIPKSSICQNTCRLYEHASEVFRLRHGFYPRPESWKEDLFTGEGVEDWRGPYIKKIEKDPWRREFRYSLVDDVPLFLSSGADRKFGTSDDISSRGDL